MSRAGANLRTYLALLVLLALTFFAARFRWWGFAWAVGLAIAGLKIAAIARNFMEVKRATAAVRVAAAAGLVWLGILLGLTLPDYLSRRSVTEPSPWPQSALSPEIGPIHLRSRD